jgi:hypothetical protein
VSISSITPAWNFFRTVDLGQVALIAAGDLLALDEARYRNSFHSGDE